MQEKMKTNKQKQNKEKTRQKNQKALLAVLVFAAVLLILALILYSNHEGSDKWTVDDQGMLSYPQNRGSIEVTVINTESGGNYTLETISFKSKDYTVEGLLRIPTSSKKVPAVVILPGATVPKEGTQGLAELFSNMGYASLGIEQRNRGGVDFEYDRTLFSEGKEPIEHKMVFDALRAVDVLKHDVRIDDKRIAILGESNGGRFAIIAAALDPSIVGVIGISTSGYNVEADAGNIKDKTALRFYRSIDPDEYLVRLPPRKLVMLHSVNDTIIPIARAESTFEKAKDPKQFYKVTTGTHGYSEGMKGPLETELRIMFQ
jgi:dienelactone hydrolase